MQKLLLIIITLSFYFLNDAFAKCDNDQRSFMEGLKLEQPSSLKVSFYDEKFEQANVNGYKGFASNGGNLGVGAVEYEEIYFDITSNGLGSTVLRLRSKMFIYLYKCNMLLL